MEWSEKIPKLCHPVRIENRKLSIRIIVTGMDGFGLTFRCKIDKILYRFRKILGVFLKTHDFCCSDRNTITISWFTCRKAERVMNLYKAPSQRDTQAIQSAKKAIEALRQDIFRNKATAGAKTCEKKHQPFHPREGTEGKVKSKELTKKTIETLCFKFSNQKPIQTCEICGKTHWPLCSGGVEAEDKVSTPTEKAVKAIDKYEANLTTMKGVSIITSTCECCGEKGIEVNHLVRIDSGQFLCPDCLKALRKVISKNNSEHN